LKTLSMSIRSVVVDVIMQVIDCMSKTAGLRAAQRWPLPRSAGPARRRTLVPPQLPDSGDPFNAVPLEVTGHQQEAEQAMTDTRFND
jgi:hypothetical protein